MRYETLLQRDAQHEVVGIVPAALTGRSRQEAGVAVVESLRKSVAGLGPIGGSVAELTGCLIAVGTPVLPVNEKLVVQILVGVQW